MKPKHLTRNEVRIIGHKNPDTDSICSAIAYAWLKNHLDRSTHYKPCRAGSINRETKFALEHFDLPVPHLCTDVHPTVRDIDLRLQDSIEADTSIRAAWAIMRETDIGSLCVTDEEGYLTGLVSLGDIAKANMELLDNHGLADARTLYRKIGETLDASMPVGDPDAVFDSGSVFVGASPELMEELLSPGDLVLVSNRYEAQLCAIECGAACIVICGVETAPRTILSLAREKGCAVIITPHDTYAAARLVSMSAPVGHLMHTEDLLTFTLDTPVQEVSRVMATVRFRYFPIVDAEGKYQGVISRRNLLNLHQRRVILVDHNENTQSVDGLDEAELLEIIDHHRIGDIETGNPVYFRNVPVGCTCTILYDIFRENGVTPPRQIAGAMLSAILSDTLMFRSPTCTMMDRAAAEALAAIAGEDMQEYAGRMFEAGSDLTGRSADDVFYSDFKLFDFGEHRVGVGQAFFMTDRACEDAIALLSPFLPSVMGKHRVEMVCFLVTNTPAQSSTLIYCGDKAEAVLRLAFETAPADGRQALPGVVSRKKQLVPPLRAAYKKLEEK